MMRKYFVANMTADYNSAPGKGIEIVNSELLTLR